MSPAIITLIAQFAVEFGIPAARRLVAMYQKTDETVSVEEWNAIFDLAKKSEDEYVNEAKG